MGNEKVRRPYTTPIIEETKTNMEEVPAKEEPAGQITVKTGTIVNTVLVNVRQSPHNDGKVIGRLNRGSEVKILDKLPNGDYEIAYGPKATTGYIKNKYVEVK